MKTNFKRIGKQSISIVLAVMMMLSTMLVGMVTSNAATVSSDGTGILYFKMNAVSWWDTSGANGGNFAYFYGSTGNAWSEKAVKYQDNIYYVNIPKGDWTQVILTRNSTTSAPNFTAADKGGNLWNQTGNIELQSDKNYITSFSESSTNATFSTVTPTPDSYSLSADKTIVGTNETVTLTPSFDSKLVSLKSNSYNVKKDGSTASSSDYSISGDSITFNNAGTYTISDTITYNANGYSSITGNVTTNDVTITVNQGTVVTYTIKTETPENGTINVSADSLAAGETFKVTATPNEGYTVGDIIVKSEDGTVISPVNGSYTMPANNVTVSATFKVKTDAKYSVTYTDPTGIEGVESASIDPTETTLAAGLAAGTTVKVTVTVKEGYTASLAVAGATVTTSKTGNTYTFTFPMPAKAITVAPNVTKAGGNTGTEIQGLYLIYGNSSDPRTYTMYTKLYVDSSKQVFAYFTSGDNLNTDKQYYFLISTSTGANSYLNAYNNNNNRAFNDRKYDDVVTTGSQEYYIGSDPYYAGKFTVKDGYRDTISSVKINLGYYNGTDIVRSSTDSTKATTYEVIPISGVEGMPQVFAKDGTIRDGYQKYADMADTVLTAENTADLTKYNNENKYYETAYAKVGTKLKITTTILPEYRDKYFVKAFSINGYSYGIINASQANTETGVYTCEYTIPEDFEGSRIEITPIYYYIDDKDTVTLYVEGFDETVQAKWGNTVAVQAWYANCEKEDDVNNSKFDSPTKNALGGYPGQPLVYEGGKYSMQIPKYLNDNKDNFVKGITLNNYFWDDIHKQNFSDQSNKSEFNCQTYDYDDFYKLSETSDVDNIIFDFRYRTTTDNKPSMDGLTKSTYNPNELEPLKDYYGNIVDIFGTILSKDWTAAYDSNYLTVISNGYKEIENIGKYATEWSVYDKDGKYITKINCSSLIAASKVDSTYQAAYDTLKQYAGSPVKIAYEKSNFGGYDKGTRADGRWYFSKKAQTISAKVEIEYGANSSSEFIKDEFLPDSNVGEKTGAKAYFTNADYSGKTTCQGEVDGGNFSVHAQTDADAKYYFIGWYLKTSDGYSFITNESDADFPMTNNETYVARFITTPSGTLTLSHTLLAGSADGKTFIKADIVDSKGNVKASIAETSGNLVIPSNYVTYTSTYKIRITLRTVPYGNDTVEDFYEGYSSNTPNHYNATLTGTGEQTYSVTREIKSLFEEIPNADGSTSYKLKKSNIPFYSNIKSVPIDYQITYTYKTRLNGTQSYVVKDTVSGIELQEMWDANEAASLPKEQLSKAFITKKAPFVSNYREEIKWNIDAAIIDGYTATVAAVTSTDKLKISALTVGGSWTEPATLEYGTLAMSNGDYLYKIGTTDFPSTRKYLDTTDYEFSFWAIFDNREKAAQYSKAVAAYMSGTPDQNMSKRLTALTKLDGYDNLISKSYSKEYNYISYQDYYIVPVYAGRFAKSKINEAQASIRLLEYTRNQWTDDTYGVNGNGIKNEGGSKTDYLYTDFALSFDKDQELIKKNANIKVGIAFEIVAKYDNVDLKTYVTDSDADTIKTTVKNAEANGKVGSYTFENANRNIYRYEIDNSTISTKNRIEYYLQFKNTSNARQNVLKVYSYIYDTVSGEIYLSDPVYMNMYDIGNLTYITSNLANINLGPDATV
jgi:uncharacterized Zn finger protein